MNRVDPVHPDIFSNDDQAAVGYDPSPPCFLSGFNLFSVMKYPVILALILLSLILASGCTHSIQPQVTSALQKVPVGGLQEKGTTFISSILSRLSLSQPTPGETSGVLTVRYLDVGQGDSILVQTPSGKTMLIDAGTIDAGPTVTSDLKGLGITTLDIVLATHPHEDHIGGMSSVLNNFTVKQFIDSGYPDTTKTYETMLNTIDQKNIPFKTVKAGDTIDLDPGISFSVLNPPSTFSDNINQNSIVLRMTYGTVPFLFMGDANSDAEKNIEAGGTDIHADILKVGHHGSSTSSSSTFLSEVQPKVSIIEVGAGNPYGHPAPATLKRLAQEGSTVYRTDLDGDITVTTDGTTYNVNSEYRGN